MAIQIVTRQSRHHCKHPGCNGILINDWGDIRCLICNREHDKEGELVKLIDPVAEKIKVVDEVGGRPSGWSKGGRPKLKSMDEIRQRQSLEAKNNNNGGNRLPNNLRELKEIWRDKRGELIAVRRSPQGGV